MNNIASIKENYDLISYVRNYTGQKGKGNNRVFFLCPFHPERTPSFVVFPDGYYKCFSCGRYGDIINFVSETKGISLEESIKELSGEVIPRDVEYKPQIVSPREVEISYAYIQETHSKLGDHIGYFTTRAIAESMVHKKLLGFDDQYQHFYRFQNGDVVEMLTPRYTIPYLQGEKVKGLNARLDDRMARELFSKIPENLKERMVDDICIKLKLKKDNLSIDLILKSIFGGKYLRKNGFMVYNAERIAQDKGLETFYPRRSYVFVTEGEFDCLSIESAGFACVAAKPTNTIDFRTYFQNVITPIFIADNDKPREDHHGVERRAGIDTAMALRNLSGKGRVIVVPNGYKDINEMFIDGTGSNFLSRFAEPDLKGA